MADSSGFARHPEVCNDFSLEFLPQNVLAEVLTSMKLPNIFERDVTPLSFSIGEVTYSEGETPNAMYVVKSGEVELKVRGKSLEVVGPEGFFGEMALIDQGRRAGTAVAKTDCRIIPICSGSRT